MMFKLFSPLLKKLLMDSVQVLQITLGLIKTLFLLEEPSPSKMPLHFSFRLIIPSFIQEHRAKIC